MNQKGLWRTKGDETDRSVTRRSRNIADWFWARSGNRPALIQRKKACPPFTPEGCHLRTPPELSNSI